MKNINEQIIRIITNQLPAHEKIVYYLSDLLDISKESAYRRIRGEIDFSVKELYLIASDLQVSIDEMLEIETPKISCFDVPSILLSDPIRGLEESLETNNRFIREVAESNDSELTIAYNRLSIVIHIRLEYIFKFIYYRYLTQSHNLPFNFSFSDLTLPPRIKELRDEYLHYFQQVKEVTFILDKNTHSRFISEVLYYYHRHLITKEELRLIQKDLYDITESTYQVTQTGTNEIGSKNNIYLSMFDINSTSSYIRYGDKELLRIWLNTITPISLYGQEIIDVQKKWFASLKKQSTLITQASEMEQEKYFKQQRQHIDHMMDGID